MKTNHITPTSSLAIMLLFTACTAKQYKSTDEDFFLKEQLRRIEVLLAEGAAMDTSVSAVPVQWHLDHMLKTINNIYDSLESSDPTLHKPSFNFLRSVVYLIGTIPRGAAQSPQSVRPPEVILEEDIRTQLETARKNVKKVSDLDENAHFNHPKFEQLNRDQTLDFLEIHTNHHLKIIDDILGK